MGEGRGSGRDEQSMVIGYGVAVGLIVFLCTFGIPMFIAGAILVAVFPDGSSLTAGICLLVIAGLLTVAGLIFVILLCAGVIGQSNKTNPSGTGTITVVATGNQQYATPYQTGAWGAQPYPAQPGYGVQQGYPQPGYGMQQQQQQQPNYTGPPPYSAGAPPPYTAEQKKATPGTAQQPQNRQDAGPSTATPASGPSTAIGQPTSAGGPATVNAPSPSANQLYGTQQPQTATNQL